MKKKKQLKKLQKRSAQEIKTAKKEFLSLFVSYLDSEAADDIDDRRAKLNCFLFHKKVFKKLNRLLP